MNAVTSHGATPIRMNSGEAEYQQKLKTARKAGQGNPYVDGIHDVYDDGPGHAISDSRTKYGAARVMPQTVLQGNHSNFEQKDAPANAPTENYNHQTGNLALGTSGTKNASQDPELFQTDALERKLALYAKAGSNAGLGNNNRANIYEA